MYDSPKVLTGLVVFLAVVTFPFWYSHAMGDPGRAPEIVKPKSGVCVESAEHMRSWHMDMLNVWRDAAVRDGKRIYEAGDGTAHEMSLSKNCVRCHANKAEFCDRCHDYVAVSPYCWDCHVEPQLLKGGL